MVYPHLSNSRWILKAFLLRHLYVSIRVRVNLSTGTLQVSRSTRMVLLLKLLTSALKASISMTAQSSV